jgi:hypothetical protein
MLTAWLFLTLSSMPCLPDELGHGSPAAEALPVVAETALAVREPAKAPPPRPPAPASAQEATRYRVVYSVLGVLGEVSISFAQPQGGVRAVGVGRGSLFGMGKVEKRVESHLDPASAATRRWVASRVQSGKTTVDTIEQPTPGSIQMIRRRTGKPDEPSRFVRQRPVLDPLGFLWRLRTRPPTRPETFEVLDGRALWVLAVDPARPGTFDKGRSALVLKGHAEPIFWDGERDPERSPRGFTIWLDADSAHTPLRLVMPLAVGEVRVDLASVERGLAAAPAPAPTPAPPPTRLASGAGN